MGSYSYQLPCGQTLLPTRADLSNIFINMAHVPSRLEILRKDLLYQAQNAVSDAVRRELLAIAQPIEDKIEEVVGILKTVDKVLGNFPISSSHPFYKDLSIPDDEWERKITALIQEFHLYVQVKILEIIGSILPVSFSIPILGLTIDLKRLFTDPYYRAILKEEIAKDIDKFHNMLPNAYRSFNGEYGVKSKSVKAHAVWSYIMNMLKKAATKLIWDLMGKLIKKFKTIWDALGLPPLPDLIDLNVASIIENTISSFRTQLKNAPANAKAAIRKKIIDKIKSINLVFFTVEELVGGDIENFVKSDERVIDRLLETARDFGEDWAEYMLKSWMHKIRKFLDKIGLSALFQWLQFDFCQFLSLIGMPMSFKLDLGNIPLKVNNVISGDNYLDRLTMTNSTHDITNFLNNNGQQVFFRIGF